MRLHFTKKSTTDASLSRQNKNLAGENEKENLPEGRECKKWAPFFPEKFSFLQEQPLRLPALTINKQTVILTR